MARDITLSFEDGTSHVYKNAPDDITPDQVMARANKEFAGKAITSLDGGRSQPQAPEADPARQPLNRWVNPSTAGGGRGSINPEMPKVGLADRAAGAVKSAGSGMADLFTRKASAPAEAPTMPAGSDPMGGDVGSEIMANAGAGSAPEPSFEQAVSQPRPSSIKLSPTQAQADALEQSKPDAQRLHEAQASRAEDSRLNAPVLRAGPEQTGLQRVLNKTVRKPLDNSLYGAVLETAGDAARGVAKTPGSLAASAWGAVEAGADMAGINTLSDLASASAKAGQQNLAGLDNPNGDSMMTGAIQSLTTSLLGGAVGGAHGAIALAVGQTAGDKYTELRQAGVAPVDAAPLAAVNGFAEYLGERVGMPSLGRIFTGLAKEGGKAAAISFLKEAMKQQGEEQATLAMQAFFDKFGHNSPKQGMTFGDYIDQVVETAAQTAIMTGVTGAGGVAAKAAGHLTTPSQPTTNMDPWALAKSKGFNVNPPTTTDTPTTQQSKTTGMFKDLGAHFGLSPAATNATLKAAEGMPVAEQAGFFKRAAQAMAKNGLFKAPVDPELLSVFDGLAPDPKAAEAQQAAQQEPGSLATSGLAEDVEATGQRAQDVAQNPAQPVEPTALDQAAHQAATSPANDLAEPTQAQKDAGNYKLGHAKLAGMDIKIENPQGSKRRGVAEDGTPWETDMQHHYGYVAGTLAADGDKLDVFVKPGLPEDWTGPAFVVDQVDPKTGTFDEHKTILGAKDEAEAEAIYRSNYTPDWQGLGAITRLPMPAFKAWAKSGHLKDPLGDISARQQQAANEQIAPQSPASPTQPQAAQAPANQGSTAAPAGVQVAGVPGAGGVAAQADGVTARPARQKVKNHPTTVRGSGALAEISRSLGGVSPDLLADLSEKVVRNRTSKAGKKTQYTAWDNPAIPGVGPLFRTGGTADLSEVARALEEAGYLEPGAVERDPIGATQRAQEIIKAELRQGGSTVPVGNPDAIEAEMQARREADRPEEGDDTEPDPWEHHTYAQDDLDEVGFTDADETTRALTEQLLAEAEALGIDTEAIRDDTARQVGEEATQDEYNAATQDAIRQAIAQADQDAQQSDTSPAQEGNRDGGGTAEQTGSAGSRSDGREGRSDQSEGLTELRPDGTLAVRGDSAELKKRLTGAGIPARSVIKSATGVLVGKTQAAKAQEILANEKESSPGEVIEPIDLDAATFPGDTISDRVKSAMQFAKDRFVGMTVKNTSDGQAILISAQGIKHALSGRVSPIALAATEHLDRVIESAKFVGAEPDRKGRNTIKEVRFYEAGVRFGGEVRTLRVVVRVAPDGSRYYDHFEAQEKAPAGQSGKQVEPDSLQPFAEALPESPAKHSVSPTEEGSKPNTSASPIDGEPPQSRSPVPADASGASDFVGQPPNAGEAAPMGRPQSGDASVSPQDETDNPGARSPILASQTEDELRAKAEREEAATRSEVAKKAAEQERLRREDQARDNRARADQTVDDFQLGQTADQQLSGVSDMFADQAPAQVSEPTAENPPQRDASTQELIELRKRASILKSLRECLGG